MPRKAEKPSTGRAYVRITALAREAGLSVQQVRNYVELGILPPAERALNGYRLFTTRHADALTVARRLIEGHGWQRAHDIMRAVHEGDTAAAIAAIDESHADLHRQRTQVRNMLRAFGGEVPERLAVRSPIRITDAAAAVGVRPSALRFWERLGLLTAARERGTGYRVYDTAQLTRARVIVMLREAGYSVPDVHEVVDGLNGTDPTQARAALARREQELDRISAARLGATAAFDRYIERWVRE
ncbi:MerR family transcriptional regulator [Flindersiella endophytica]